MNISNNTILITGGSSGIGLAIADEFLKHGNVVIICGRNAQKLEKARLLNPKLRTITCDVSDDLSAAEMVNTVLKDYPSLNMLVNNAGMMHLHDVAKGSLALALQKKEIMTNVYGVISLCDRFIPHLMTQKQAAIVNVTSGLAYMPFVASPVYAATKAAIHSYSLSIRSALKNTSVSVFEVLPPVVDTEMSHGIDMPGMKKMSAEKLAQITISKINKGQSEIRPGAAAMMIKMYRWFPWMINKMMSSMTPKILAELPRY
jgi:uncharacterized oxidoreductase